MRIEPAQYCHGGTYILTWVLEGTLKSKKPRESYSFLPD
jgi:hypothetical protein